MTRRILFLFDEVFLKSSVSSWTIRSELYGEYFEKAIFIEIMIQWLSEIYFLYSLKDEKRERKRQMQ